MKYNQKFKKLNYFGLLYNEIWLYLMKFGCILLNFIIFR